MRSIGLDVHRDFCEVAISEGGRARSAGRVETTPEQLELFAQSLAPNDRVVLEATGNALAILRILEPHVGEVVLAHPKQLRAISHAKVKSDKVDARMLAELLVADLIPRVWVGDERTRMLRRRISRRRGLVKAGDRGQERGLGRAGAQPQAPPGALGPVRKGRSGVAGGVCVARGRA
jgi:transposase